MKLEGLDINVRVEGVLVEENRATCVMGHVEAIREKLVVNIYSDASCKVMICHLPAILLFEGIFFSPTGSRVPVVDAESPLHNRTGRNAFAGTVHVRRGSVFSFRCLAKLCGSHILTHEVKISVPEESNSSQPDKITSFENGSTRRSGKGLS